MKNLICIQCNNIREKGRRYCRNCYLIKKREEAKNRPRYCYNHICVFCNNDFIAWRKSQVQCGKCYKKNKIKISKKNYIYDKKGKLEHRVIAESIISRKLDINECVHHLDDNPKNNNLNNLVVISRENHGKLHAFLRFQKIIYDKFSKDYFNKDDSWETILVPLNLLWLEIKNINFIRLSEISSNPA